MHPAERLLVEDAGAAVRSMERQAVASSQAVALFSLDASNAGPMAQAPHAGRAAALAGKRSVRALALAATVPAQRARQPAMALDKNWQPL